MAKTRGKAAGGPAAVKDGGAPAGRHEETRRRGSQARGKGRESDIARGSGHRPLGEMEMPVRLRRIRLEPRLPAALAHARGNASGARRILDCHPFRDALRRHEAHRRGAGAGGISRGLLQGLRARLRTVRALRGPAPTTKAAAIPEEARPAMEACGIDVFATARRHGFTIEVVRDYKEPQHYFGLVLVE